MPEVMLKYGGRKDEIRGIAHEIAEKLSQIVFEALSGPETGLAPTDVEVECVEYGEASWNTKDISIRIEAKSRATLMASSKERCDRIHDAVRALLPGRYSLGVWLVLVEAEYAGD